MAGASTISLSRAGTPPGWPLRGQPRPCERLPRLVQPNPRSASDSPCQCACPGSVRSQRLSRIHAGRPSSGHRARQRRRCRQRRQRGEKKARASVASRPNRKAFAAAVRYHALAPPMTNQDAAGLPRVASTIVAHGQRDTQRHAHANLTCALRHGIGQRPVDAHGRDDEAEHPEQASNSMFSLRCATRRRSRTSSIVRTLRSGTSGSTCATPTFRRRSRTGVQIPAGADDQLAGAAPRFAPARGRISGIGSASRLV